METKSTTNARAYWSVEAGRGEIRAEADLGDAEPGRADTVLVRTTLTGVSRGTEALVHQGLVPSAEHERMRAPFQKGDFPFPVKYGYMAVGVVEEGPPELFGKAVFCLHPHQDRFRVPQGAVVPLPAGTPPSRAVLAANMETAVNVAWDAQPHVGDRIAVVGAGVVGLLVGSLMADVPGTDVWLIDPDEASRSAAAMLGLSAARSSDAADLAAGSCDLVVHASGTEAGLRAALPLAGPEARVVEASWHGANEVTLPLGEAFHSQRLDLRSSQVGIIPPHQARRWTLRRRMELALRLLSRPAFEALITSTDPFEEIADRLPERLADPSTLCATFAYS